MKIIINLPKSATALASMMLSDSVKQEAKQHAKPIEKPSEPITRGSPAITHPYCPITPGYQKKQEVVQLSLFD